MQIIQKAAISLRRLYVKSKVCLHFNFTTFYYKLCYRTRETLASGNLLSVINVLMQLRKVCNHPNLFEVRPTTSPFLSDGILLLYPSLVRSALDYDVWKVSFIVFIKMKRQSLLNDDNSTV